MRISAHRIPAEYTGNSSVDLDEDGGSPSPGPRECAEALKVATAYSWWQATAMPKSHINTQLDGKGSKVSFLFRKISSISVEEGNGFDRKSPS